EAVLPDGRVFRGARDATIDRYEAVLRIGFPAGVAPFRAMLRALDVGAMASTGRRFSSLDRDAREGLLDRWRLGNPVERALVGALHSRHDVSGRSQDALRRFYRDRGFTFTVGNTIIPIPIGRMVGGSTAINTGTCWRTPERVLRRWRESCGLVEFTAEHLAPY